MSFGLSEFTLPSSITSWLCHANSAKGSSAENATSNSTRTVATVLACSFTIPILARLIVPANIQRKVHFLLRLLTLLIDVRFHGLRYGGRLYSFADKFENAVDKIVRPFVNSHRQSALAILDAEEGRGMTLAEMEILANRCAHWARAVHLGEELALQSLARELDKTKSASSDSTLQDYLCDDSQARGGTVAIMMENSAAYVCLWLGLAKAGVTAALINTHARGTSLVHAVTVALSHEGPRILITDRACAALLQASSTIKLFNEAHIQILIWEDLMLPTGGISVASSERLPRSARSWVRESDTLLYIYTSGTTGFPKASKISHSRFTNAAAPFRVLCDLQTHDVVYSPLPMYHSAAGMLAVGKYLAGSMHLRSTWTFFYFILSLTISSSPYLLGACLVSGATLLTRRRFSASCFSADCVSHKVTVIQYIGEICR